MQLENWGEKAEVELLVPAGQLAIGQVLISTMYSQGADLSALDLSQQQQLQLLQLSDAYDVPAIARAVCKSISSLPSDQLHWDTATAILTLPDSCKQLPSYGTLHKAAADKLQQQLGDLELVWAPAGPGDDEPDADPHPISPLQQQLLQLPFPALLLLLADLRTRVSSEDTAFYTLNRWLQHNLGTSKEQQHKLAGLLRLTQCTPSYLASVICAPGSWVLSCFSPSDLISVAAACGGGSCSSRARIKDFDHHGSEELWASSLIHNCNSCVDPSHGWALPPREPSKMRQMVLEVKVPMSLVQKCCEQGMVEGDQGVHKECYRSSFVRWQGRELALSFTVLSGYYEGRDDEPGRRYVIFGTELLWRTESSSCPVTAVAGVVCWQGTQGTKEEIMDLDSGFSGGEDGSCELVNDWVGDLPATWEDLLQELQQDGMVHEGEGGGYLCFSVVITKFH